MNVIKRNNVVVKGRGSQVIMFAHGFGCDQNMWRYVSPAFEENYKIILFDHVGAGGSDLSAFVPQKYEKLEGYADDIVEIATALQLHDIIFVGHSVSAVMGIIASQKSPELFKSLVLVAPSPSYINDCDYVGGFTRPQIDELLESLDKNHLGWSMAMAPVIMGNPDKKELGEELANSFCRTDPAIVKHFARATFLTDKRELLSAVDISSLILQCSDDVIAPREVGTYMHQQIKGSKLVIMRATGHCPNLSAPEETIYEIMKFLS
ncbi:MAG: alpha/beta hydrolase [Ferruginibacter sp.]